MAEPTRQNLVAPMPVAPVPPAPVQQTKKKDDSPYVRSLDGGGDSTVGSLAKGVVRSIARPVVQTGLSLIDPFADLTRFGTDKTMAGNTRIKSKFLSDDGFVYSFIDTAGIAASRASKRYQEGEVNFSKGLLSAWAGGVEGAVDLGALLLGGGGTTASLIKSVAKGASKNVMKDLVLQGMKQSFKRGGIWGGAYDIVQQLKDAKDYNAMRTLGSVALGTALDLGVSEAPAFLSTILDKSGNLVYRAIPQSIKSAASDVRGSIMKSAPAELFQAHLVNKKALLKTLAGDAGEKIASSYQRAHDRFTGDLGKFQKGLVDLGLVRAPSGVKQLNKLARWEDQSFRFDVRDALGRTGRFADNEAFDAAMKADPELRQTVEFFDNYRKDKGLLGQQMNIVENLDDIDKYFSRYTPHVELKKNLFNKIQGATSDAEREALYAANSDAVREMIEYGVQREGKWSSMLEGYKSYYDAMDASFGNKRIRDEDNTYYQWLVKNGHASSIADAKERFIGGLNRRQDPLTPRASSFDYERDVPLPWNDPNAVRVMTKYVEDTSKRIAFAQEFGVDDEIITGLINDVKNTDGTAQARKLEDVFRRMTGQVERRSNPDNFLRMITNVETLHLWASALSNIPAALNYAIPTDFMSFGHGLKAIFSQENMVKSLERGTYLADLARQTRTMQNFDTKMADFVMDRSGFGRFDMAIKTMASGVADTWTPRVYNNLLRKLDIEVTEDERAALQRGADLDAEFQKKSLREGYKIQKTAAKEFNTEFKGEDFTAVAGERGRARNFAKTLDATYNRELKKLQGAQALLERTLERQSKPLLAGDDAIKSLVSEIKELREQISIYEGGPTPSAISPEEQFSDRQVTDALAEAKALMLKTLNDRVTELTDDFDAARAVGQLEGPSFKAPEISTEQKLAQINEKLLAVRTAIKDSGVRLERKKSLLGRISDSYELAQQEMANNNPDIVSYRSGKRARKEKFAISELSKIPEYHYLRELGLEPEEMLARGFVSKDDLATATRSLVENTQGTNNPLMTPLFAETPMGKVFYQFKKISLQQSAFMARQFKRNLISKDTRSVNNAMRFMVVTAGLYPLTTGATRDLRDLITGKKKPDEAFKLDEYFTSLNSLAATGLFMDFSKSFDRGREAEFFLPAAVSDAKNYLKGMWQVGKGAVGMDFDQVERGFGSLAKQLARQTGVAEALTNRLKKK